jgi:hypothetical protein
MDRIAARKIIRRVLLAMLAQHTAGPSVQTKTASLPTGGLLIALDMFARAQFLEGLAGKTFNSVSAPAGRGRAAAKKVIEKLLLHLDPTINPADLEPKQEKAVGKVPAGIGATGAKLQEWVSDQGSSGLYKAAWLGANKVLSRGGTKTPRSLWKPQAPGPVTYLKGGPQKVASGDVGMSLEPGDILSANMLRFISPAEEPKLSEGELDEMSASASMEEKLEALESQEGAIKEEALSEAANSGNFFWMAGKSVQGKKDKILGGDISIDRLGGIVARYAANATANVVDKMATESRALARALSVQMLPGVDEERTDFDLGELTPTGWGYVIQAVLGDPDQNFSQEVFDWMRDDVKFHPTLNDKEKQVMTAYIEAVIDGRLSGFMSTSGASAGRGADKGFVDDYNARNPDATVTPNYFGVVKLKYLGKDGVEVAKRLRDEAPEWKLNAEDQLFLMNAQQGRGRFAAQKRTAEEEVNLRSKLIRLAHANPAMRPHLLPLISRTAEDNEGPLAGRTWGKGGHGNGNPGADWDWNKPEYASHEDSPAAGANGSAARLEYNRWYRKNVCPSDHSTNCGNPALKK